MTTRKKKFILLTLLPLLVLLTAVILAGLISDEESYQSGLNAAPQTDAQVEFFILFSGEGAYSPDLPYLAGDAAHTKRSLSEGGVLYTEHSFTISPVFWLETKSVSVSVRGVPLSFENGDYSFQGDVLSFRLRQDENVADSEIAVKVYFDEVQQAIILEKEGSGAILLTGQSDEVGYATPSYKNPVGFTAEPKWSSEFSHWNLDGVYYSSDSQVVLRTTDMNSPYGRLTAIFKAKDVGGKGDVLVELKLYYMAPDGSLVKTPSYGAATGGGYYRMGDTVSVTATGRSGAYYRADVTTVDGTVVYSSYSSAFQFEMDEKLTDGTEKVYLNVYFCHADQVPVTRRITLSQNYAAAGDTVLEYLGFTGKSFLVKDGDVVTARAVAYAGFLFRGWSLTGAGTPDASLTANAVQFVLNRNAEQFRALFDYSSVRKEEFLYAESDNLLCQLERGVWTTSSLSGYSFEIANVTDNRGTTHKAAYFGLHTVQEEQYSMEGWLLSPALTLPTHAAGYTVSFDAYSKRGSELPNELTLLASADGVNFTPITALLKISDTTGGFNTYTASIADDVQFLRFDVKVYYDGADNLYYGVYLDNIALTQKAGSSVTQPDFTVQKGDTSFVYNGQVQTPDITVKSTDPDYVFTYRTVVTTGGRETVPVNAGSYELNVLVYSSQGLLVDYQAVPFNIDKRTISVSDFTVQYIANREVIILTELLDDEGVPLSDYLSDIAYVLRKQGAAGSVSQPSLIFHVDESATYYLSLVIAEQSNYYGTTTGEKTIYSSISSSVLLYADKVQRFVYDGTEKEVGFIVSGNYNQEDLEVEYRKDGLNTTPLLAGVYDVTVTIQNVSVFVTLIIEKRILTYAEYIGLSLDKYYDGNSTLFYQYKNHPSDTSYRYELQTTLKSHDLSLPELVVGDDVVLDMEKAYYARKIGKTYVQAEGLSISGADAENYCLANDFSTEHASFRCEIIPITLQLQSNYDGDNIIFVITERQYNNSTAADIDLARLNTLYGSASAVPLAFYGLASGESVTVLDLSAMFYDPYAGTEKQVYLTVSNLSLLDRYQSTLDISALTELISGTITRRSISVDAENAATEIVTAEKTYDGTRTASAEIKSAVFGNVLYDDAAIFADAANFRLEYTQAQFANAEAGIDKEIILSGVTISVLNNRYRQILESYEVTNITVGGGVIHAAEITLISNSLSIRTGEAVPAIETDPAGLSLTLTYYTSENDAKNGTGGTPILNTAINGDYYVRAEYTADGNYKFADGYALLFLKISTAKNSQIILFLIGAEYLWHDSQTGTDYYKMAVGGKFVPNAVSKTGMDGFNTGLPISYDRVQISGSGVVLAEANGVFTAGAVGEVQLLASNGGNDYYDAASRSIHIVVEAVTVAANAVSTGGTLYYGDNLPAISGSVNFGLETVLGDYSVQEGTLSAGTHDYSYTFIPSQSFLGYYEGVLVSLVTEKAGLEIIFDNLERGYYTDIDYLSFAEVVLVKGLSRIRVPVFLYESLGISLTISNADAKNWLSGTYTVYLGSTNDPAHALLSAEASENYDISLLSKRAECAGGGTQWITVTVVNNAVTVRIENFLKPYGKEVPTPDELRLECIVEGTINPVDRAEILAFISIYVQANRYSALGEYVMVLQLQGGNFAKKYDLSTKNGYLTVVRAEVTVTALDASHVYGSETEELKFRVDGIHLAEDIDLIRDRIRLDTVADTHTGVGTYDINVAMTGALENYSVSLVGGHYSISPAEITGVAFPDKKVVYNGKRHSLTIEYDEAEWGAIVVAYSVAYQIEVGKYTITATINVDNYNELTLTAVLTITALSIKTSSSNPYAELTVINEDSEGFDPEITFMLTETENQSMIDAVHDSLINTRTTEDVVLGVFDFSLTKSGSWLPMTERVEVRLKLAGVTASNVLKIFVNQQGVLKQVSHQYQNGYIVFEVEDVNNIAVVQTNNLYPRDTADLVLVILIGVVVLFVLIIIVYNGIHRGRRERSISRRKHSRWA